MRLLLVISTLLASLPASAELIGQECAVLDGVNSTLSDPYPYVEWRCHDLLLPSIEGTDFQVRLRWNRHAQPVQATVAWLNGADGSLAFAELERGAPHDINRRSLRQRLDEDFSIRSIEIQFLNTKEPGTGLGGYWAGPRIGYIKPALALMAVLEFIRSPSVDLIQGAWWTQVGSSNGATAVAFALAYLNASAIMEKVVLLSGPFLSDVLRECADPGFPAYIGENDAEPSANRYPAEAILGMISDFNGWEDCRAPGLIDDRRSLLGPEAVRDFPETDLTVIVGAEDQYGPWLLRSNAYWYEHIRAGVQSRVVLPHVMHSVLSHDVRTENLILSYLSWPPGLVPAGVFMNEGQHIFYSNGGHYCHFASLWILERLSGLRDVNAVLDYQQMPAAMHFDGQCGGPMPLGVFSLTKSDIYHSDGMRYCYFPAMWYLEQLTGLVSLDQMTDYEQIHPALIYKGICQEGDIAP